MEAFEAHRNSALYKALVEVEQALHKCDESGALEFDYTADEEAHIRRLWGIPVDISPDECFRAEMGRLLTETRSLVLALGDSLRRDPVGNYDGSIRDFLEHYRVFFDHATVILSTSSASAEVFGAVVRQIEISRRLLVEEPHPSVRDLPSDVSLPLLRVVTQNIAGLRRRGWRVYSALAVAVAACPSAYRSVETIQRLREYEVFMDESIRALADETLFREEMTIIGALNAMHSEPKDRSLAGVASDISSARYANGGLPFADLHTEGVALQLAAFIAEVALSRDEVTDRTIRECQTLGLLLRNSAIALAHSFGPKRKMVSTVCVP